MPGAQALRIAASIHIDLEASIGSGPWMIETSDRLDRDRAATPGRAASGALYLDGLPLATA